MSAQEAWIARQNIENYDRLLEKTSDERQRDTLHRLKAEAEAKLTQIEAQSGSAALDRRQSP